MEDDVDLSSIHIFKERAKKLQSEVITAFNYIELQIIFLIAAFYFQNNNNNKEYFIQEILFDSSISANAKIRILRNILKRKKLDDKICNKLEEMNRIRNLFAHSSIFYDKLQDTLFTRKIFSSNEIDLNEKHKIFFKYFMEVSKELSSYFDKK